MSDLDQLINQIPLDQVARQLGVDQQTASEAVSAVIPALLGGMGANAQDPNGEASLARALGDHAGREQRSLFSVDDADVNDGEKIVRHVFGDNTDNVVNQLSGARPALGSSMLAKLLPLLAPLVMQWLANKWSGRTGGQAAPQNSGGTGQAPAGFPTNPNQRSAPQPQAQEESRGGGLGDLLGGILGGGQGGGLGDLLGGILGKR